MRHARHARHVLESLEVVWRSHVHCRFSSVSSCRFWLHTKCITPSGLYKPVAYVAQAQQQAIPRVQLAPYSGPGLKWTSEKSIPTTQLRTRSCGMCFRSLQKSCHENVVIAPDQIAPDSKIQRCQAPTHFTHLHTMPGQDRMHRIRDIKNHQETSFCEDSATQQRNCCDLF